MSKSTALALVFSYYSWPQDVISMKNIITEYCRHKEKDLTLLYILFRVTSLMDLASMTKFAVESLEREFEFTLVHKENQFITIY